MAMKTNFLAFWAHLNLNKGALLNYLIFKISVGHDEKGNTSEKKCQLLGNFPKGGGGGKVKS